MKHENNKRNWKKCLGFLCVILLCCCGCHRSSDWVETADTTRPIVGESDTQQTTRTGKIYVHICGCVKKPGLYQVDASLRVGEVLELAGGFSKKADRDALNLAAALEDGMQVYVPSKEEMADREDTAASGMQSDAGDSRVDLNTASADELMTLSGIGEAKAERIVAYREKNGRFSSIEDIKNVSGIGDGIFEKIKDYIKV